MKKSLIQWARLFFLTTTIIFIGTTIFYKTELDKQIFKVYSFEGEVKDMIISDGLIILSPDKHIVSGGKIQYLGSKQESIKYYSKTIYFNKQGNKDVILSNQVSFEGKTITFPDELLMNKDVGEISSEKLFNEDDINTIIDNLYFSLNYETVDGKTENFTIKLKVKEYNMNLNK